MAALVVPTAPKRTNTIVEARTGGSGWWFVNALLSTPSGWWARVFAT